ncbi:MAG: hypothetical protein ACKO7C_05390 [Bacteroidota bacterium]
MKNVYVLLVLVLCGFHVLGQEQNLFCGERDARVRFFGINPEAWDAARMAQNQLEIETSSFGEEARGGGQTLYNSCSISCDP